MGRRAYERLFLEAWPWPPHRLGSSRKARLDLSSVSSPGVAACCWALGWRHAHGVGSPLQTQTQTVIPSATPLLVSSTSLTWSNAAARTSALTTTPTAVPPHHGYRPVGRTPRPPWGHPAMCERQREPPDACCPGGQHKLDPSPFRLSPSEFSMPLRQLPHTAGFGERALDRSDLFLLSDRAAMRGTNDVQG